METLFIYYSTISYTLKKQKMNLSSPVFKSDEDYVCDDFLSY